MIKAVIFDADGVLIHGDMFSKRLQREYGVSTEITTRFFDGPFQDCLVGKADLKEVIVPYLKEWSWTGSVEELLHYWFEAESHIDQGLVKYIQALRSRGITCYLGTNQEQYRFAYMLHTMGFSDVFDDVYASSSVGYQKPDTNFFRKIFEDIGNLEKDEVLFWDDHEKKVQGARDFGIRAEVYTSFESFLRTMRNSYALVV